MHALVLVHSELIVHSGRQCGGAPMYVGRQEHDGEPFAYLHSALEPQGDG